METTLPRPGAATPNKNLQRWQVGEVTVTAVREVQFKIDGDTLIPACTPEGLSAIPWLRPHFITPENQLLLRFQAFVVETPTRRIIVDTCFGNDKTRSGNTPPVQTDFLERLEGAGFATGSIDVVLCTHLHVDHVGWNTRLQNGRWVPTFPNARYLIAREEFEFWREGVHGEVNDAAVFEESVRPVFDAGLVDLVAPDHRVCEEVRLRPTPGHTPGHVCVEIVSAGQRALITGDMMHHPCQIAHPDWACSADNDSPAASATRGAVLETLVGEPVLVIGTHFAAPSAGRIVREAATYRFEV